MTFCLYAVKPFLDDMHYQVKSPWESRLTEPEYQIESDKGARDGRGQDFVRKILDKRRSEFRSA